MLLRNFDMNLFIVLHTLMEERSVTRAGERLGKTQSAISNSLRRLRQGFRDPLFVRSPQGLVPTPRTEEICRLTADMLAKAQECLSPRSEFDCATAVARVAIGAPDRLGLPLLLPFIRSLAHHAPGISVDLRTSDREHAIRLIEEGEIDMAIGSFEALPNQINAMKAFDEPLVVLMHTLHPLNQKGKVLSLDDILSFPHLVVSSGGDNRAAFDTILRQRGRERSIRASLGNFGLVPALLKDGDLVGVFTRNIAAYFAQHYDLVYCSLPLDIEPIRHRIIWHRRFDRDQMQSWVRDQLHQHCRSPGKSQVQGGGPG